MRSERMNLGQATLPNEFEELNLQEQQGIDGGSRKDEKQKGWFDKILNLLTGGTIGGGGGGTGTIVTS